MEPYPNSNQNAYPYVGSYIVPPNQQILLQNQMYIGNSINQQIRQNIVKKLEEKLSVKYGIFHGIFIIVLSLFSISWQIVSYFGDTPLSSSSSGLWDGMNFLACGFLAISLSMLIT